MTLPKSQSENQHPEAPMAALRAQAEHSGGAVGNSRFWLWADRLVASSEVVIDRPCGSRHPRFPEIIYPLDYGYLARTTAMDDGGVDVWLGSLPERRVVGAIATIDLRKRDAEIKLLLGCNPAETTIILDFLNSWDVGTALIRREEAGSDPLNALPESADSVLPDPPTTRTNHNNEAGSR